MSFDVTTLALAKSYTDQHGGGGGGASTTSDFIIKMTVTSDGDYNYTVTSCDATVEQIDAAVADGKRVVVIVSVDGTIIELPMVQGVKGDSYYFSMFLSGQVTASFVQKVGGNTSEWQFLVAQIEAESIDYSNAALPNISTVGGALDELVPKSHTHANKSVLDKFAESDGKPTYDGKVLGGGGAGGYAIGDGLKVENGKLSVDTATVAEQDNTKPITSGAVYTAVGNINALLATI